MTVPSRFHDRQGSKTHFTHSYLWTASQSAFWQTHRDPAAARHAGWGLLALTAGALAAEAYLNYLGPTLIGIWGNTEDRLSPKDKLKRVAEAAGYTLDLNGPAYHAFCRLFALRNRLAHGRPERVEGSWSSSHEDLDRDSVLEVDWMAASEPTALYQLLGLVQDLLTKLARCAGEDFEPFATLSQSESRNRPHAPPR